MQRLLDTANEYNRQQGINTNYQIQNYADIVEAIHVVQTEMGITGTTAKEAASTIEGSLASAKSAWQNLLTGIADDNADFDTLINNFVESASTAFDNVLPRIETSLEGIGKLVSSLAPVIAESIPELVDTVLPSIIQAAVDLVTALVDSLVSNGETVVNTALDILDMLVNTLMDNAYVMTDGAVVLITTLVNGISERLPDLIPAAVRIILEVAKGLLENTGALIAAAGNLVISIGSGIIEAIPDILYAPVAICTAIADGLVNYDWSAATEGMMNSLISSLDTAQKHVQVWLDNTFSGGTVYGGDIANVDSTDFIDNMRDGTDIIVNEIAKSQEEIQKYYNDGKEILGTAQDDLTQSLKDNAAQFDEQSRKNSDIISKAIEDSTLEVTTTQKRASTDIKSTYDNLADTEKKAAEKAAEETKKNFKSILDSYDKQLKEVQNKIDSFSQKLTGAYKDFYTFETDEEGNVTGAYATDKMRQEQQKLQEYYDLLLQFTERGVGTDMIGQLADVSQEEGQAMLQYWNSLTDEQLHALQVNYNKVVDMSSRVSELLYSEKSKEVANSVVSQISEAVETDPQFQAIGEMMLNGIIAGLNSGQFDITEAANRIYTAFGNYFENGTVTTTGYSAPNYPSPADVITTTKGGEEAMPTETAAVSSISDNSDLTVEINIENFNNYTNDDIDALTDKIVINLQDKINQKRVAFS